MCGIFGFLHHQQMVREDIQDRLLRMERLLAHRGPDGAGRYIDECIALGHRRLSIVDPLGGSQPIFNENNAICLIANAEIYNDLELRKSLQAHGHVFRSVNDCEVIVHLYEEDGLNGISKIQGMFAFALWDKKKNRIILARDRVGIKPLFYTFQNGLFTFASELKPLLVGNKARIELNLEALNYYLTLGYVPGPMTIFKGIWELSPGNILTMTDDEYQIKTYWDVMPYPSESCVEHDDVVNRFIELIRNAVERQVPDLDFGVLLSGGLDSGIISAILAQNKRYKLNTFCVGYEKANSEEMMCDETMSAQRIADYLGTNHTNVLVSHKNLFSTLEKVVWHLEQPLANAEAIALYTLFCHIGEKEKVVLSGEGADELFAGYDIYGYEPGTYNNFSRRRKNQSGNRNPFVYYGASFLFSDDVKPYLCLPNLFSGIRKPDLEEFTIPYYDKYVNSSVLWRQTYVDFKQTLPCDLLCRVDRMSMAHGVEVRVPFLDKELIDFAFALPDEWKRYESVGKYLLRKGTKKLLPDWFTSQPKRGFPIPLRSWILGPLHEMAEELFLGGKLKDQGFFNHQFVNQLYKLMEKDEIQTDIAPFLYAIMVFELWHQMFIESKSINEIVQ
jgi:asparagine synthase (glutamine-hydrolysing)